MHNTVSGLIAFAILACCTLVRADTVASVTAVSQPVWIQLDDLASELDPSNDIALGDRIISGAGGRAEILLWSGVILRLYPDSEILVRAAGSAANASPELFLRTGRLCLQSGPPTSSGRNFRLNLDGRLLATIQQSAHICADQREKQSRLGLISGSVQLLNNIDPAIVILSEPGFEFMLAADGSYRLLPPGSGDQIASVDQRPFIVESKIGTEKTETEGKTESKVEIEKAETKVGVETQPAADSEADSVVSTEASPYIYTVYLFSTRDPDVAAEVNRRLQNAGHDTRIFVGTKGATTYHRVAVSGFTSHQAAREYSDSIVGTNGISDSWIGRDRAADSN